MASSPQHVVIELFVVLSILNASLGLFTLIYQESETGATLRSPFDSRPLGNNFTQLDTETLTLDITGPENSTGDAIPWVANALQDFSATVRVLYSFSAFFTLGFLAQLLSTLGLPDGFEIVISIPFAIYSAVMIFSIFTGKLRG